MRFTKFVGLFIIALVVSLNFSGSCLYAEENNSLGVNGTVNSTVNGTNVTNSSDINYIQVNLSGQVPYFQSPSQLGDDYTHGVVRSPWMAKPVMHTPDYRPPHWSPPGVRKKHWYNFFGWLWDCCCYALYCVCYGIACAAYSIAYAAACIGYAIWFTLQMVAWFFVIVAWVPVGIYDCISNIGDFCNAFTLFGWCFAGNDNLRYNDSSRVVNIPNETVRRNMTINTTVNSTLNSTSVNMTNDTANNSSVIAPEPVVVEVNESVDVNQYLLDHRLSSFSNSSLENVTDKNLTACITGLDKQENDIKKTFLLLNTLFEAVNNIISLIETFANVITCIAGGLSVPTEGGSIPAAAGTQVAKESAKLTFQGIFQGIILEGISTMVGNFISKLADDKYYVQYGKASARGVIVIKRMYDTAQSIKKNEGKFKVGKGFFGIVRDTVGMLCTLGELFWSFNHDIEKAKVQEEQDYRRNHHLSVC